MLPRLHFWAAEGPTQGHKSQQAGSLVLLTKSSQGAQGQWSQPPGYLRQEPGIRANNLPKTTLQGQGRPEQLRRPTVMAWGLPAGNPQR